MTRKQLRLLLALACSAPLNAFALGVGQIQVRSALNQALDAEIPLLLAGSAEAAGITAKLAPTPLFAQKGIDRLPMLSNLVFTVQTGADGRGLIRVTSKQPIREPLLNFLIQVDWPKGQVVREFAVLLDPPVRARQRPAALPAPSPTVATFAPPAASRLSRPRQPAATVPPQPTPSPPAVAHRGTATYGPVPYGETLWSIASRVRPDPAVGVRRMMQALLEANPKAFWKHNVDGLRAGATLRLPSAQEIDPLRFPEEVSRQLASRQQVPLAPATPKPAAPPPESRPKVKLVPPELAERPPQPSQPAAPAVHKQPAATVTAGAPAVPIKLKDNHPALRLAGLEELRQRMTTAGSGEKTGTATSPPPTAIQPTEPRTLGAPASSPVSGLPPTVIQPTEPRQPQPELPSSLSAGGSSEPGPRLQEALPETMAPQRAAKETLAEPVAIATLPAVTPSAGTPPLTPEAPPTPMTTVIPPVSPPAAVPPSQPPIEPLQPPASVETKGIPGDWLKPASLALLAGLGLLLGGGTWYWWQRRTRTEESSEEALALEGIIPVETATTAEPMIGPGVATAKEKESVTARRIVRTVPNPVERADLLLAVGNYAEAENLLRRALREEPDNNAVMAKLLDVHFANRDTRAFLQVAQELYEKLQDKTDPLWSHVAQLGQKFYPGHELFSQPDELLIATKTITANLAELEAPTKAGGIQQGTPAVEQAETTLFATLNEPTLIIDEQENANLAEFDWQLSDLDKLTLATHLFPEEPTQPRSGRDRAQADSDKLTVTTIPLFEESTQPEGRGDKARIDAADKLALTTVPFFEEPTQPRDDRDKAWVDADKPTPTTLPFPEQPTQPETRDDKTRTARELEWRLLDLEQVALNPQPVPGRTEEKEKPSAMPSPELDFAIDSLFIRKNDDSRLSPTTAEGESDRKTGLPLQPPQPAEGLPVAAAKVPTLMGEDYAETKLDLALAYLEMGDPVGANSLLEEVLQEGNEGQRQRARAFMEKVNLF